MTPREAAESLNLAYLMEDGEEVGILTGQDALDGAALRRLREAVGDETGVIVFAWSEGITVETDPLRGDVGEGATIAEAADMHREALG